MIFNAHEHLQRLGENAHAITYGSSTTALLFWGLHLSDIGVIVSSLASVCGVGLQFYIAIRRFNHAKNRQETQQDDTRAT